MIKKNEERANTNREKLRKRILVIIKVEEYDSNEKQEQENNRR